MPRNPPNSRSDRRPDLSPRFDPWRETPRKLIVILLLSVFLLFATVGFANDVMVLGRQAVPRFVLAILISGGFAVLYAIAAISLLRKSWMVIAPVLIFQIVLMGQLVRWFPNLPQQIPIGASDVHALQVRLILDSAAILTVVSLGYAGFFHVAVNEAKRYVETRTAKALLESEMTAARQVQHVILPDTNPIVPGFAVDSVYKPAREVGGDFFQVLPVEDNGLLLAFGDVSGKGLPAAMLVSLVIGSVRATVEDTHDPVVLLRKLNSVLAGRTPDGLVTALAVFVAKDGRVTFANAGHLSPYLDGQEVQLPGGLPLGVGGDGDYQTTSVNLQPGSRLTFVSDGVVEAQSATGELFGFDRARAISQQPAATIAEAAVQFGQVDDITVVTIERRNVRIA